MNKDKIVVIFKNQFESILIFQMDTQIFSSHLPNLIKHLKSTQNTYISLQKHNQLLEIIQELKLTLSFDQAAIYVFGSHYYTFLRQILNHTLYCYYGNQINSNESQLLKKQLHGNPIKIQQTNELKIYEGKRYKKLPDLSYNNQHSINDPYIKQKLGKLQEYLERLESLSHKKTQILSLQKSYSINFHQNGKQFFQITLKDLWKQTQLVYQNAENQLHSKEMLKSDDFFKISHFFAIISKYVIQITSICTKIIHNQRQSFKNQSDMDSIKQKKSQKKSLLTEIFKEVSQKSANEPKSIEKTLKDYRIQSTQKKRRTEPVLLQEISFHQLLQAKTTQKKKKQLKATLDNCTSCSQCTIY